MEELAVTILEALHCVGNLWTEHAFSKEKRFRDADAVSSCILGTVERAISGGEQLVS